MISLGSKSGVHCILEKEPFTASVITLAAVVFASPGTDSNKIWPLHIIDTSNEIPS